MVKETVELDNGAEVKLFYDEDECTASSYVQKPHDDGKEALKEEAVSVAKDVFGPSRVEDGFIIEDGETGVDTIDVGVVIGKQNSSLKAKVREKFNLMLKDDIGQLDEVGNGLQYCPIFSGPESADYRNAPDDMDSAHQILYFGLSE
jgi:hypothetical protein